MTEPVAGSTVTTLPSHVVLDARSIEQGMAKFFEEAHLRRFAEVDRIALAWLAIPPLWTDRIAGIIRFPTGPRSLSAPEGLAAFLSKAEDSGLVSIERTRMDALGDRARSRIVALLADIVGGQFVERALSDIQSLASSSLQAGALAYLAGHLQPDKRESALRVAREIVSPSSRAHALAALVQATPSGGGVPPLDELTTSMEALPAVERASVIAMVATALDEPTRTEMLIEALKATETVAEDAERARLLSRLAPVIGSSLGSTFVESAEHIVEPSARASVLATAADVLSPELVRRLRAAFGETAPGALDLEVGSMELAAATVGRDPTAIEAAVATARRLADPGARAEVLGALAVAAGTVVPEQAAQIAEEAADLFETTGDTAGAVLLGSRVSELLIASGRTGAADALLRATTARGESIGGGIDNVRPLTRLAHAQRSSGDEAAAAGTARIAYALASNIGDAKSRVAAVVELIRLLPADDVRSAVAQARNALVSASDPSVQAEILALLAPELDPSDVGGLATTIFDRASAMRGEVTFAMPDDVRTDALEYLTIGTPPIDLQAVAADIGSRLTGALHDAMAVPPPLARWADLARQVGAPDRTSAMISQLSERIQAALAFGDVTEATSLIAAGTALAPVVGAQMDTAVRLANRRLALLFRRARDSRHLQHYLERRDQTRALNELLTASGDGWALHFLGMGGVGKTMLIRFLMAELAPRSGYAAARVDFDYMCADYPVFRPGELFLDLMGELETYASSTAAGEYIRRVEDAIVRLHEELSTQGRSEKPLAGLRRSEFEDLLVVFRDFLWSLDRPVLLILDTCEELAKVQSPDLTLPSVEATFEILERLRENGPPIKVVFAGRRLLARAGEGWRAGDLAAGEARARLPDRKAYLRLHEIRPFSEDEARGYLARVRRLSISSVTTESLLELSGDTGTAAAIEWDVDRTLPEQRRFNPFDLSLYADWAAEMDDPTPEDLGGVDQGLYVERRIIGRLGSQNVRSLVAPAILLRRFDRAMIRPAFGGFDDEFESAFRELSAQEWIDLQGDERQGGTMLLVDDHLYERLRRFYDDPRRFAELEAAGRRLAPGLRDGLSSGYLNELSVEYMNAALRLLSPADASEGWNSIVHRVAKEGRWDWADRVTARLLADEETAGAEGHANRAAIAALRASSVLHLSARGDNTTDWGVVDRSLSREPDAEIRDWLGIRRAAAVVASGEGTASDRSVALAALRNPGKATTGAAWRREHLSLQVAAALCPAADRLVEQLERTNDGGAADVVDAVIAFSRWLRQTEAPADLTIMSGGLAARASAIAGRIQDAVDLMAKLPSVAGQATSEGWLDWLAPANLEDAVRLDQLRLDPLILTPRSDTELRQWIASAKPRLAAIDSERMVSAALATLLSRGPVSAQELDELEGVDTYDPERRPIRSAHRDVEPLFVTISAGRLALGDADGAIAGLQARIDASTATGTDDATRHAADAAKVRIARRMRLSVQLSSAVDRLAASDQEADVSLALPAMALTRDPRAAIRPGIATLYPHVWWRTRTAVLWQELATDDPLGSPDGPSTEALTSSGFDVVSLAFDRLEVVLMGVTSPRPRTEIQPAIAMTSLMQGFSPSKWAENHPSEIEHGIRLALRSLALGISEPSSSSRVDIPASGAIEMLARWQDRVGARRLAELALDEGELLALRLPGHGATLLALSRQWFVRAGDRVGALIAATCELVATVRATPRIGPASEVLKAFQNVYTGVSDGDAPVFLPAWAEVEQAVAGQRRDDLLQWIERDVWGPWVLRAYLALAWLLGPGEPQLPPTIGAIPRSTRPVELVLDTRLSGQASAGASGWRLALLGLGALFGVLAAAIIFLGALMPASSVVDRVLLIGVLLAGGGIAVASTPRLRRFATSLLVAASSVSLAVNEAEREATTEPASSRATARFELLQLLVTSIPETPSLRSLASVFAEALIGALGSPTYHLERRSATAVLVGAGRPYRPTGPRLPGDVVERLRWSHERLASHRQPLALDVAGSLAGAPWDALVVLAAEPNMTRPSDCRLDPFRRGAPTGAASVRARRMRVTALVDRSSSNVVTRGWGINADVTAIRDPAELSPQETDILHIIGRPVETSGGTVLQVAGREGRSAAKTVEQTVRGLSPDSGGTVRPESLLVRGIPLVIVQEEPVEASTRAESDRVQAARLRAASDLIFRGGAGTVIMIPALPPALADEVVLHIGRLLGPLSGMAAMLDRLPRLLRPRAPRNDLEAPLAAVREARDLIVSWQPRGRVDPADSAGLLETALDITVFARTSRREVAGAESA